MSQYKCKQHPYAYIGYDRICPYCKKKAEEEDDTPRSIFTPSTESIFDTRAGSVFESTPSYEPPSSDFSGGGGDSGGGGSSVDF
jgi:uncharacterized membrane protein YgcG